MCYKACFYSGGHGRKNYTDFLKLFCNTLNNRCVTKHVFITEDTGGKRHTHYNIRTRV